jgi:hypothetical protein
MTTKSTPNFIVCDVGSCQLHVYDPTLKQHHNVTPDDFLNLNIPCLKDGMSMVIEDAHLRSREDDSMAQTYTIEQLKQIKLACDNRNIEILCFPQKSTPKARKIYSLDKETLIEKTDENDCEAIAFYLINFPNIFDSLKEWQPMTFGQHEERTKHLYKDRETLTLDSNLARNAKYGIGKYKNIYSDAVSEWIKKYITKLYSELDQETRDVFKLGLNRKGNALQDSIVNYTNETVLKQIYNVVNTILTPDGEPRVRSDIGKVPHWKYAKEVYFGLTPYHEHAGVTASNYKWHKRRMGSNCKLTMTFEDNGTKKVNTVKSTEDVKTIREEMKRSDRSLRTLWRTVRKMIVEDSLR